MHTKIPLSQQGGYWSRGTKIISIGHPRLSLRLKGYDMDRGGAGILSPSTGVTSLRSIYCQDDPKQPSLYPLHLDPSMRRAVSSYKGG